MRALAYERASDPRAAQQAVTGEPDTMFLAGGTNLVDLMKLGVHRPDRLIDITGLGLDAIEHRADGSVLIGATVRNSALAADPGIRSRFPALSQALLAGASGQLRNMATTAGNLLQRTRCVYFQDTSKPCNKREPGSGCSAIEGAHRDLALLGTSDQCVASHPSDMAVALAALDARVHVQRADGARDVLPSLDALYREPGDDPSRDTTLQAGDLITAVELPAPPAGTRMAYRKVRDRWSYAFALVSVAVLIVADEDGRLREARIALGGVGSRPWRARRAEALLAGTRPDPGADTIRAAIGAEFDDARPLPDNAFKAELAADTAAAVVADLLWP
ncbi:MAG TPA: xanthine dehydrogenase family protein subunit M [Solirubrobacteraceae bacterium]|jgi:xanthine dehydrogenase YagS FAD-binding subunit